MSPSQRRAAARGGAALAGVSIASLPWPVAAHALGGTYQLPVPLWLYLAGAGTAVAASFVVVALMPRGAVTVRAAAPPSDRVAERRLGVAGIGLRLVGLVWWYGAILVGFAVGDITRLPAVLFWVGIWIALPIVAVVAGNPWPALSPLRATFDGLEWLAARGGVRTLDAGLRLPMAIGRWPAVALLWLAIWAELILPGGSLALTVAGLMLGYTLLTMLGMLAFGREAWLNNVELFEMLLGWYGRIGPVGPGGRWRGWFTGLTRTDGLNWSDVAFVVLLLAGVTYDGLRETAFGATLLDVLLPPVEALLGLTLAAFVLVDTLAFTLLYATFLAAFLAGLWLTRAAIGAAAHGPMGSFAGRYAATLLPIAAGYVLAHYLTLVIQAVVWLPTLVTDPLRLIAPSIDWIPVGFVWYLSVAAIVGGHVAGVTLAHRLTAGLAPGRAVDAGLPMVLLMVGYTVLSLWIIAQPIVVEPGPPPAEATAPRLGS